MVNTKSKQDIKLYCVIYVLSVILVFRKPMTWDLLFWNVPLGRKHNQPVTKGFYWMLSKKLKHWKITRRDGSLYCLGSFIWYSDNQYKSQSFHVFLRSDFIFRHWNLQKNLQFIFWKVKSLWSWAKMCT